MMFLSGWRTLPLCLGSWMRLSTSLIRRRMTRLRTLTTSSRPKPQGFSCSSTMK